MAELNFLGSDQPFYKVLILFCARFVVTVSSQNIQLLIRIRWKTLIMIAGRDKNTDTSNTLIIKPFLVIMSVQYNLYQTGKSLIKNYLPYTSFGLSYKTRVISLSSSFRSIVNIFFSLESHVMHSRSWHGIPSSLFLTFCLHIYFQ